MELETDQLRLKIKSDALKLLSFRPRSVAELSQRLEKKHYPPKLVAEAIESFRSQGFLDDEKFAKLFSQSLVDTRPTGKKGLEQELKKKGLSEHVISAALSNLKDFDEAASALELAKKRFRLMAGIPDIKKKSRIYGFLKRRGFSDHIVFEVIRQLLKEDV